MIARAYHEVETHIVVVQVKLWESPDGRSAYQTSDGVQEVPMGAKIPSYLRVDKQIADLIGIDYQGKPKPRAEDAHLTDTIKVRDRLLTLVEAHAMDKMDTNLYNFVKERS